MMKNIIKTVLAIILGVMVILLIRLLISRADAVETTQSYTPAHYMILAAEINVSSPQSFSNTRKVLVRTNTKTGQCWVLELTVLGDQNFKVSKAHWKEVAARGGNP